MQAWELDVSTTGAPSVSFEDDMLLLASSYRISSKLNTIFCQYFSYVHQFPICRCSDLVGCHGDVPPRRSVAVAGVLGVPNGSTMVPGEGRNRKLNSELANGRLVT